MFVSSSISKSGRLFNITGDFSNDEFLISEISPNTMPYNLTLDIKPTKNVIHGNYTLTVSARYENSITYSKILDFLFIKNTIMTFKRDGLIMHCLLSQ
jgi:virginiamycin B lyase